MNRYVHSIAPLCILLIAASVSDAFCQTGKQKEEAKKLEAQALEALTARKFAEAADLYGKSLALVPNNAAARYRKGDAHHSLKEYDKAVTELNRALELKHPAAEVQKLRYLANAGLGNYDAALGDVNELLKTSPNDPALYRALGEFNLAKKAYPEALTAFKRSAELGPDKGDTWYGLARAAAEMRDAETQADAAQKALDKGTNHPGESYLVLAQAHHKQKRLAQAIDAYKRVIALKPEMFEVSMTLADLYLAESRFTEAIETLKNAQIKVGKPLPEIYSKRGLIFALAGRGKEAEEAARSAVRDLPNEADPYTNLCRALIQTREYGQAVVACENSLRRRAGDGEAHFYHGFALERLRKSADAAKEYANAIRSLTAATAADPSQWYSWYLLGNAYFGDKQFDKSIESYIESLKISPNFSIARLNLGVTYIAKKNKPAATEQYNMLMKTDPDRAARLKEFIDAM